MMGMISLLQTIPKEKLFRDKEIKEIYFSLKEIFESRAPNPNGSDAL